MFLSPSFNSLWVSGTQSVQTSQAPLQGGSSRKAEISLLSSQTLHHEEVGGGGWLESTSRLPLSLLFALSSLEKPWAFEQSVFPLPGLSAFMPKSLLQSFEILNLCPPARAAEAGAAVRLCSLQLEESANMQSQRL